MFHFMMLCASILCIIWCQFLSVGGKHLSSCTYDSKLAVDDSVASSWQSCLRSSRATFTAGGLIVGVMLLSINQIVYSYTDYGIWYAQRLMIYDYNESTKNRGPQWTVRRPVGLFLSSWLTCCTGHKEIVKKIEYSHEDKE